MLFQVVENKTIILSICINVTSNNSTRPSLQKVKKQPSPAIHLRAVTVLYRWHSARFSIIDNNETAFARSGFNCLQGNKCPPLTQSLYIDQELIQSFAFFMQNHQLQRGYRYQSWMQTAYTSILDENQGRKLCFLFWQNTAIGKFHYLIYFFFSDCIIIAKLILAFQSIDSSCQHFFKAKWYKHVWFLNIMYVCNMHV